MVFAYYLPCLLDKFLTFMELAKLVMANSKRDLKVFHTIPL